MPLLPSEFLVRYPEFQKLDGSVIELFLSDAETEVSSVRWGKLYKRGVMALTAHLLKLRANEQDSGGEANRALANESAGELSVGYVTSATGGTDDYYQLTSYGQEYLRLRKLIGVGIMVA